MNIDCFYKLDNGDDSPLIHFHREILLRWSCLDVDAVTTSIVEQHYERDTKLQSASQILTISKDGIYAFNIEHIAPGLYVNNQQVTRNEHGDYELYEAFKKYATDINQSLTIAVDPFRRPHPQNMQPEFFNFYEPCRIIIDSNSDYPADELNKFLTFVWNSNSGTIRCKILSNYMFVELSEDQNRFQLERIL